MEETQQQPPPVAWSWPLRLVFRICCCYFVLYNLPTMGHSSLLGAIPGGQFLAQPYIRMWRRFVPWVATTVFHLSGPVTVYPERNGSGDTTLDYVQNFCILVLALLAVIIWSILDRKRPNYIRLNYWLRLIVRYSLAFTLLSYGMAKVVPMQFSTPYLSRLIQPYGDSSPMGILWTFMGASMAYTVFAGLSEVAGGLLLLFRRTTTLGAMVSAGVLLNVVMLNFCYDVPVKLYSSNLLLMAIFLLAPDMGRLANLLVLQRTATPAPPEGPAFGTRWMRISMVALKVVFVGFYLTSMTMGAVSNYKRVFVNPVRPPLYGLYEVETFVRNGAELPPLTTDVTRWRKFIVQFPGNLALRMMDDSQRFYQMKVDEAQNKITLSSGATEAGVLTYSKPDADHLTLQGTLHDQKVDIRMRKLDASKFLLVNRGFNWINERPFNR